MQETKARFNLLDDPWILVLSDGENVQEVSLTDALVNAHKYRCLAGELPTQDIAVLRLLLAVLYTVFTRVEADGSPGVLDGEDDALDRWAALWEMGQFPKKPLLAYLEQWHERFYLFHPERPFYQVPEAEVGTEYTSAKLNGTLSESANKIRLFPMRWGRDKEELSCSEAARWLIYVNAYDDTSSKPKGKGLPSPGTGWLGKLGLISAEGGTLFETLLLNLPLMRDGETDWGICRPVWELDTPRSGERTEIALPDNPAELLTLQSRRLILRESNGVVRGYSLLGGDFFSRLDAFTEQMTVWRPVYEKKQLAGFQPRRHDPSKQMWREFSAITDTGLDSHRPGVVAWIAKLRESGDLEPDRLVRLKIVSVQYGDKDFFINHVFSDTLTFHSGLLRDMGAPLRRRVEDEIQLCDKIAKQVGTLASDLETAAGGKGSNAYSQGMERYYAEIDKPFRDWLEDLDPSVNPVDVEEDFTRWRETAFRTARRIGRDMADTEGDAAFIGREVRRKEGEKEISCHYSAPEAFNRFERALRKLAQ